MMRKSRFHNNEGSIFLKDDFQSILHSLCTLINVYKHCKSHLMECKSIVFVTNQIPYKASISFIDFYSCEIVACEM